MFYGWESADDAPTYHLTSPGAGSCDPTSRPPDDQNIRTRRSEVLVFLQPLLLPPANFFRVVITLPALQQQVTARCSPCDDDGAPLTLVATVCGSVLPDRYVNPPGLFSNSSLLIPVNFRHSLVGCLDHPIGPLLSVRSLDHPHDASAQSLYFSSLIFIILPGV